MAYVTGTAAANRLVGTAGNDVISALEGDDLIDGLAGNDILVGGLGADTFVLGAGGGEDAIADADGTDVLLLADDASRDMILFRREGADLVIRAVNSPALAEDPALGVRVLNHFAGSALLYVEADFPAANAAYGEDPALTRFYLAGGVSGIDQGGFGEIIIGGAGADVIAGNGGFFDSIDGGAGNDRITTGNARFATIVAGDGNDSVLGGAGREIFVGGRGLDTFDGAGQGADGGDLVDYGDAGGAVQVDLARAGLQWIGDDQGADLLRNIEGVIGSRFGDSLSGSAAANLLVGRDGADLLDGRGGADTMDGGLDGDTYRVDSLGDLILEAPDDRAQSGQDRVISAVDGFDMGSQAAFVERIDLIGAALAATGNALANVMRGSIGANSLSGALGNDQLFGFGGNDILVGGPDTIGGAERDADRLVGGAGADTMSGGAGNDVFDFNDILDSGVSSALRDVILDFTIGAVGFADRIDLRDIDAVAGTLTVNEAFAFRGTAAFTGAGQVRVVQSGADVIVELNTDLDIPPEMTIRLLNQTATAIESLDFLL